MYPAPELTRLAAHKAVLRRDIALRRAECVEAASRVMQPVEWLDRVLAVWRRLLPLALGAAVPLAILGCRGVARRLGTLRSILRWASLVLGAVRVISAAVKARPGSSQSRA
jgi:hypothetical protein